MSAQGLLPWRWNPFTFQVSQQFPSLHPYDTGEPMPELQPGQAMVEVKAIGLNFADLFCALVRSWQHAPLVAAHLEVGCIHAPSDGLCLPAPLVV